MAPKRIEIISETTVLPESLREMFRIWDALPKPDKAPLARSFSLESVPTKILPWSALVDVVADEDDYLYKFWGTERVNLIGTELTQKKLSQISDKHMREGNKVEYDYVRIHGCPVLCQSPITSPMGLSSVLFSIRLPLTDTDGNIAKIFSTFDPNSVTQNDYDYFGTSPLNFF